MSQPIALVTGANKAIGLAVTRALARLGMTVYLGSRDETRGREAEAEAKADGDVRYVALDVTDETTLKAALGRIEAEHGRLDVLINNAGVAVAPDDAIMVDPEVARRVMEVNAHGPARLTQLAAPLLRKSKAGRVVFVSSGVGSLAAIADPNNPSGRARPYAYCLSKVAMNGVTVLFADAFRADGIKVNAANPGYVKSAVSRFLGTRTPEEGAQIIVKLATLDDDGPTGGFFNDQGVIPW
jgi:NAD(P)-dependent dehydrogenase (short-subunit alcohol dehydrogenase family)